MHGETPLVGEDGLLEEVKRECSEQDRNWERNDEACELIHRAGGYVRKMSPEHVDERLDEYVQNIEAIADAAEEA